MAPIADIADEIITLTKTVEEKVNLTELRDEIKRIEEFIASDKKMTIEEKAKAYDREHNIEGWVEQVDRLKTQLTSYEGK